MRSDIGHITVIAKYLLIVTVRGSERIKIYRFNSPDARQKPELGCGILLLIKLPYLVIYIYSHMARDVCVMTSAACMFLKKNQFSVRRPFGCSELSHTHYLVFQILAPSRETYPPYSSNCHISHTVVLTNKQVNCVILCNDSILPLYPAAHA